MPSITEVERKTYNFISSMDDAGRMYSNDDGFVFFIKLNAEWLEIIRKTPRLLVNPQTMTPLLEHNGRNIHFIGLYGNENNKGFLSIRKGMREFIAKEKPISVSWFSKDMSKFNYRRLQWQA